MTTTTTTTTTAAAAAADAFTFAAAAATGRGPSAAVPARKKAKSHRKRHVPVGPAGVWFQSSHRQQRPTSSKLAKKKAALQQPQNAGGRTSECAADPPLDELEDEETAMASSSLHHSSDIDEDESDRTTSSSRRRARGKRRAAPAAAEQAASDLSLGSPAWMCMQCDLNLVLPALPPPLGPLSASDQQRAHAERRREALRQCLPPDYLLLPDLVAPASTEWKLRNRRIVVLVVAIQSLTDNLWTVKVTDETSAVLTGWIQPRLVREEQQRQQPKFVRPGLVWQLVDPTLILVSNDGAYPGGADGNSLERMLLISEETIERVWTPAQAKEISDDRFVAWLEQRNVLSASLLDRWDEGRGTALSQMQQRPALPSKRQAEPAQLHPFDEPRLQVPVEDRAPAGNFHASDDEEFTWVSPQVAEPRRLDQRNERPKATRQGTAPGDGGILPSSEQVARTSQRTAPPSSQTFSVKTGATEIPPLSTASSRPGAGTAAGLTQRRQHDTGEARDRVGPGVLAGSESSLPMYSQSCNLSPAPQTPAPSSTRSTRSGSAGTALSAGDTFGFSRYMSPPPIPASDPARRREPKTAVVPLASTAQQQLDSSHLTPLSLPPSPDRRRASPPTTHSSKSRKRRRRERRSRAGTLDDEPPRIHSPRPPPKPSALWDAADTSCLSILDAFEEEEDEEEEQNRAKGTDAEYLKSGTAHRPNADPATPNAGQRSDDEHSDSTARRPPGPSLFQAVLFSTEGLDGLFSDADED
jgi:hypothetical protein